MDNKVLDYLKKFWNFVWYGDSLASWIISVLLAFVFVKFIVYPLLGLLLSTSYPVVAVISGSMEHKLVPGEKGYIMCGSYYSEKKSIDFDSFWQICGGFYEDIGISKEGFSRFRFKNGFNTGDVMVIYGTKPKNIKIGDVIVFMSKRPEPIIHRVVNIKSDDNKLSFMTKGDHNINSGPDEMSIGEERIIGRAILKIPLLGYVKIAFVKLLTFIGIGG